MEFVDKKLSEITPYKNNPRNNDEAVGPVAESIKEFGFKVPIVVDKNGEIVSGHTRYKAAQKLGLETVPVIVADDLSEEQIKAFRLADNKVGEIAVWDLDLLNEELNDILDLDMSAFGFDVLDNLDDLIEDEKDLDDFTGTVPDEPKSKLGDIYQLGSHKLMCGDSTNGADVKKLMNGELADLLLTDPPYNVAYEGKTKDSLTIKNDSMDNDSFRQFLVNAFSSANEVMKPGAVFYIWHADSEGYNFRGACFDIGWTVRQCLIWNKNSMVLGRQDYHWKHEPCLYGWKDGAGHLWASDRKQTTVIDYEKPQRNGVHPTMKPVGLFDYQIKNNTKGSDIVLDLFGGSGTTLIACESNGRHARLMEYDPKYVDVIIKRWEELTGESVIQLN
ncbi:TPA: ParB N-terminal domain-containing protein [Streptococcus pyogenes]|nr:ParB N-terminal domain-containing protein [Streptococcus pyogenes]HEP5135224.1 ParB N-terminal domain-containing protein [Streptococcus pyogenes]